MTNYSYHAVHYIPRTFYNWKFVPLTPFTPFSHCPPPSPPPSLALTHLFSVSMSSVFFVFCFFISFFVCLFVFKLWVYLFIHLFMAVLGLRFCARAFSSCGKQGPLFIAVRGPFTVTACLVVGHRLQTRRLSSCGSRA